MDGYNAEVLNESELNERLNAQIQATMRVENDLAALMKQRDQSKQKAKQIDCFKDGNKFVVIETIKKLVDTNSHLTSDICEVTEKILLASKADPQQSAREWSDRVDKLRAQNQALHLERQAKEVVYDYLLGNIGLPKRQLRIVSNCEVAKDLFHIDRPSLSK